MSPSLDRRRFLGSAAALGGAALLGGTVQTATAHADGLRTVTGFQLPDGFMPEGIIIRSRPYAYVGSLVNGDIYRASLRTGRGSVISKGLGSGHAAAGLQLDRYDRLFVCGVDSGEVRTVDTRTGEIEKVYTPGGFVNDVSLTPGAAWFTDSLNAQIFRLSLGEHGKPGEITAVPLTGDWEQGPSRTANGICHTPDGSALLMANNYADGGCLMRVDPRTGVATLVDLGDAKLPGGDGVLLVGRIVYVTQPQQNLIDVFRLNGSGTKGKAIGRITDSRFDIPTTVAAWQDKLYLPNNRIGKERTPATWDDVVQVDQLRPV
ncbi:superoxide dismutase [Streptomyces hokutonensis]|uniref:superoxide dismutase n=1 Tax=Streptomyces hokutonensis TaxID=1306990 RepID=UPI0037F4839C